MEQERKRCCHKPPEQWRHHQHGGQRVLVGEDGDRRDRCVPNGWWRPPEEVAGDDGRQLDDELHDEDDITWGAVDNRISFGANIHG